jgi:hypothetical protein
MGAGGLMFSGFDDYIEIAFALTALVVVIYFFTRKRSKKSIGNAPTGTDGRASRIGRRQEEPADTTTKKKTVQKWGRGSEDETP